MSVTLITGPVRSGKSRFAERLARDAGCDVTYVATAALRPDDPEWAARIAAHRRERPPEWTVVESARDAARALPEIVAAARPASLVIVDSLGTWLAAEMDARPLADDGRAPELEAALDAACRRLDASLRASAARIVLVSEEVGWGIVPLHPSARVFRDVLGRLHQALALHAERCFLVVNGFAIDLRAAGTPIGAAR